MNDSTQLQQAVYQPTAVIANPGGTAAVWSLITGILAYLCLPGLGAVLAVVLGFYSRAEALRYRHPVNAGAIAGIVLGSIQLGLGALALIFWIVLLIVAAAQPH